MPTVYETLCQALYKRIPFHVLLYVVRLPSPERLMCSGYYIITEGWLEGNPFIYLTAIKYIVYAPGTVLDAGNDAG